MAADCLCSTFAVGQGQSNPVRVPTACLATVNKPHTEQRQHFCGYIPTTVGGNAGCLPASLGLAAYLKNSLLSDPGVLGRHSRRCTSSSAQTGAGAAALMSLT